MTPANDEVAAAASPGRSAVGRRTLRWITTQVASLLLTLFLISVFTFALLNVAGADAAVLAGGMDGVSEEQATAIRERLGLDRPLVAQYGHWAFDALQGDLGESYANNRPVTELIIARTPVSVSLTLMSIAVAIPLSLAMGLLAGAREGRATDRVITGWTAVALGIPTFWIGILLAFFVAVRLGWFPATGYVSLFESPLQFVRHMFLPALTLAIPLSAQLARQLRGSLADVLSRDYVRSAEARGLSWRRVLGKHALKNAAIPTVTLLGVRLIQLLGGTVIIEQVFNLPGLGTLAIQSVLARDLPTLQGIVVMTAIFGAVVTLLIELLYSRLDPRIKAAA